MLWKSVLVAFAISSVPSHGDNDANESKKLVQCDKTESDKAMDIFKSQDTAKNCGQMSLANLTLFTKHDETMMNMAKLTSLCTPNCVTIIRSLLNLTIEDCSIPIGNQQIDIHDPLDNVKDFCENMSPNTNSATKSPGSSTPSTGSPTPSSPTPTAANGASTLAQSLLLLSSVSIVAMMW